MTAVRRIDLIVLVLCGREVRLVHSRVRMFKNHKATEQLLQEDGWGQTVGAKWLIGAAIGCKIMSLAIYSGMEGLWGFQKWS